MYHADISEVLSDCCSNESQYEMFINISEKVSYFRKHLDICIGIKCAHW